MRRRPGEVRDAIVQVLEGRERPASVEEITGGVADLIGEVAPSSVRSYLRLNTPELFARMAARFSAGTMRKKAAARLS